MLLPIVLLFLISISIGGIVFSFYNKKGSEAVLMSFGFGVCVFPIFGILFSFFNALNFNLLFVLALVVSGFVIKRNLKCVRVSIDYTLGFVLLCSFLMFGVFLYGGFNQVWLEDGDPNGHAVAASYIARYNTFLKPVDLFVARYMEPYPVGFQMWTGLLAQWDYDVVFSLMFFNYFIISISYIFIYYLVLVLFKRKDYAAVSSLMLIVLPTYSTRFIFSQSLAVTQVVLALYFIAKLLEDKRFVVPAGVVIGSLLLTHQTSAIVLAVFMVIWALVAFLYERRVPVDMIIAGFIGVIIALPWWLFVFVKYGVDKVIIQLNLTRLSETAFGLTDPTLKFYTIHDFIDVPLNNTIDNMTGIGIGIFLLLVAAVCLTIIKKDKTSVIFVAMTLFGVLAVFSNWLPVSFVPTRMWVYMSIPLVVVVSRPFIILLRGNDTSKVIALFFIFLIIFTSLYPKVFVTIQTWGNSRFNSFEEYNLLFYLKSLPIDTKVIDACMYERVWGLNLWDDPLDRESFIYRNAETDTSIYGWDSEGWIGVKYSENATIFNDDIEDMHLFLVSKNYEYIIVGSKCIKHNMLTNHGFSVKIYEMDNSGLFKRVFSFSGENVFKVLK